MHKFAPSKLSSPLIIFAAVFAAVLFWNGQTAAASDAGWKGAIEAMPANGLTGQWTVAGRDFTADDGTEFRQENGAFAVGVCVEVDYVGAAAPYTATKIASKNADDCSGMSTPDPSPDPSETPSPEPSGTPEAEPSETPEVEPSETPEVGPSETPEAEGTSEPEPSATPGSDDGQEIYGRVDAMPADLVGTWTIDGVDYAATAGTEFKQEDGAFAVGACVKVHLDNATPATIREIETERDYRCGSDNSGGDDNGGDDNSGDNSGDTRGEAELYGVVRSLPADLIGTWDVGGMLIEVDSATQFDQEHGAFAEGVTVKVHFSTDAAGVHHAREIETKFANDDHGEDDDGNGAIDGREGHAYGTIDSFPAGLVGTWQIGGIDYNATDSARFSQEDGAFDVGVRVKVEYFLDANETRTVKKIETTSDEGGVSAPEHAVFFGFVRQMPATGLVGDWTVDSAVFTADSTTQFKENNGLLGIGAYVKVEYTVVDGVSHIHELETHVPPGAGPDSSMGVIDDNGGGVIAAAAGDATWVIGGVTYTVLPATQLDDQDGALTVGSSAVVNSYVAADGAQVATRIRGVTVTNRIFLPVVTR
ncbi:MAG: procyclic acidic repetitive family protein [Caldilineaceae bacterium]|nr:procyclic acidic repetitive family protein [Caldilineaceae bacterium]